MKRPYYIFSSGKLSRKENTVFLYPSNTEQQNNEETREASTKAIDQEPSKFNSNDQLEFNDAGLEQNGKELVSEPGIGDINDDLLLEIEDTSTDSPDEAPTDEQKDEELRARPKKIIPVEDIESIYIFGEVSLNTKFLTFASQNQIPIHVFNYYGYYSGSYYPREFLNSGFLLVKQVQHYLNIEERLRLAKKFVLGAAQNILRNLKYYNSPSRSAKSKTSIDLNQDKSDSSDVITTSEEEIESMSSSLTEQIETIQSLIPSIHSATGIQELMAVEGNIRQIYYTAFEPILGFDFEFKKRVKRPPNNAVNTLISFGNSMVYTAVLGEIYKTQLSPLISYLHEPGERRFSLALDIAEIFKPILSDRIIFKVLNKRIIQENDFEKKLGYAYMKESGRKAFIKEFDDRLQTTIQHRGLGRSVSYRTLIRLECYKLVKHLLAEKEYEPFQIWW